MVILEEPSARPLGLDAESIMVVEDERSTRRALSLLLSSCGYRPEAFETAEEALSAFQERLIPRVALVDLDLPGMNGLEFIKKLQILDPHVFPILITATDEATLEARLRERPVAYLRKPLNFNLLLSLLRQNGAGRNFG
jgi:CheY-like chemotaxis protein